MSAAVPCSQALNAPSLRSPVLPCVPSACGLGPHPFRPLVGKGLRVVGEEEKGENLMQQRRESHIFIGRQGSPLGVQSMGKGDGHSSRNSGHLAAELWLGP